MNPARHGPTLSTGITFKIRNLPRCVVPRCFTHSYSDRCVRRRFFGKQNEPADGISNASFAGLGSTDLKSNLAICSDTATSVQRKSSTENRGKTTQRKESRALLPRR